MQARRDFADLVGCLLPLQLASLGGAIGSPALVAAVSEAGGLGMIPNPSSAAEVERVVQGVRALTSQPIGVSFLVPFVAAKAVESAAARAEVVEFFYGDPDAELVELAKEHGAACGWQTGSAAEAVAAVAAGCDFVVVQGVEAGGHVRGKQHLDQILADTLASVRVPVVAAGGIGSAERVATLMAAGAAAVRVGTRFVAAEEADAHPTYVSLLIEASHEDTVLSEAFNVGWPNAPHRVLRSAVEAATVFDGAIVAWIGDRAIPPLATAPPTRKTRGEIAAMALYAGESVDHVTRVQTAREIVEELIELL